MPHQKFQIHCFSLLLTLEHSAATLAHNTLLWQLAWSSELGSHMTASDSLPPSDIMEEGWATHVCIGLHPVTCQGLQPGFESYSAIWTSQNEGACHLMNLRLTEAEGHFYSANHFLQTCWCTSSLPPRHPWLSSLASKVCTAWVSAALALKDCWKVVSGSRCAHITPGLTFMLTQWVYHLVTGL